MEMCISRKSKSFLLAGMHPVLERSSFSLVVRIRLLEQNLGFVIAFLLLNLFNDHLLARVRQTRNYLSSNHKMSEEKSIFCRTA
jgi:hypothetical protein